MINISDIVGVQFECTCGKTHTVHTLAVRVGKGALSSIAVDMQSIASVGSQIALLYSDHSLEQARKTEKELVHAGYRVFMFKNESAINDENYFSVIVGVGGGKLCDRAKLLAKKLDKKLFLVSTSVSGVCGTNAVDTTQPIFVQKQCALPSHVIIDYNLIDCGKNGLAAGFGEGVSRLFSLLDNRIANCINGERFCDTIYEQIKEHVTSLVKRLENKDRRDNSVKQIIVEHNTLMSLLDQQNLGEVYGGGEVSAALFDERLSIAEQRPTKRFGESLFLQALALTEFYKEGLFFNNKAFLPPPNNNYRAELISQYLNVDEAYCHKYQCKLYKQKDLELMKYRLGVYSAEIKKELIFLSNLLKQAKKIFYKLYDDDGYAISGIREEGSLSVALAPDISNNFTCLEYFKQIGVLDNFLY